MGLNLNPEISVIMPVFNAELYIKQAIESVLAQTYQNFELLLIDDCGTDASMEVARSFRDPRIRILRMPCNMGIANARNAGLREARGKYIALLDDDDMATKTRFQQQWEYLETHLDVAAVGGRSQYFDTGGQLIQRSNVLLFNPKYIAARLLFCNPISNGEIMFRRSAIRETGLKYCDNCLGMEDFRFWIEFSKKHQITNLDELFLLHRVYPESETSRQREENAKQRADKFAELQELSWELSGFSLSAEDRKIIHRYTPETAKQIPRGDEQGLRAFYTALQQMVKQAEQLQMPNAAEVKIACRKMFSRAVEFSYLWA